jgi:aminotransferase in exopolysaccharide biosynthesis
MTTSLFFQDFVEFTRDIYSSSKNIPLHAPRFEGNERDYVANTLESTYVSSIGHFVDQFEDAISEFTGAKFTVVTINGTAALHAALLFVGVQDGDEVITQPLTFVATCNAISYCGADPIFVDVDRSTLGLSPDSLIEFLTRYAEVRDDGLCWNRVSNRIIRACVPVHNLGHPVRVSELHAICERYNIVLVEDAAEALGSFRSGIHAGRTGKMGVFSFNGNKIITAGGGGAVITDDEALARKFKHRTTTAKVPHPWLFLHDEVGFNYRLPNLNAAVGCGQMEQLPSYIERKRDLARRYQEWFVTREPEFVIEPEGASSNCWLNAILLKDRAERDAFLQYTNDCGVMTRPMWTPMHTLPMYRNCRRGDLSNSEIIECRLANIPSSVI